jgi:2-succinyl-5-enolpyruvyl-6-hydroxy-3-cyclohexene-1-carboxylate synthase
MIIFDDTLGTKINQNIHYLSSRLTEMGMRLAVISPGSRNAPLTIALNRNPNMECWSQIDERSAGFIALGASKSTELPVALCCTSGTALLNYYPAIAEAYYTGVPLVVLSADRPPELIDRWDGQAIRQENVFENHILGSYSIPDDIDDLDRREEIDKIIEKAIELAVVKSGPVHINVPFREPLYDDIPANYEFEKGEIPEKAKSDILELHFSRNFKSALVVNGANRQQNPIYDELLGELIKSNKAVVINDVLSNLNNETFPSWDGLKWDPGMKPELLITTGKFNLSKDLKQFLRTNKPMKHFHVFEDGEVSDQFFTNPENLYGDRVNAVEALLNNTEECEALINNWKSKSEDKNKKLLKLLSNADFNEFSVCHKIAENLKRSDILHLANSTTVRYFSYLKSEVATRQIHSNRGTSGIDGCSSTAVGMALTDKKSEHVLVTGDVAFFYDVNAFWRDELPKNLKVVILNNKGGGIFRYISGPSKLPELEKFFETQHDRNAEKVADDLGLKYYIAKDFKGLAEGLKWLNNQDSCSVLEIETDREINQQIFTEFKEL